MDSSKRKPAPTARRRTREIVLLTTANASEIDPSPADLQIWILRLLAILYAMGATVITSWHSARGGKHEHLSGWPDEACSINEGLVGMVGGQLS